MVLEPFKIEMECPRRVENFTTATQEVHFLGILYINESFSFI